LWMWAPNIPTIVVGAFLMQSMVTGAWGIIPAHINELSPMSKTYLLSAIHYILLFHQ